ncbi:MAG: acyl-CoA dehydrogenase family protein [Dehalococcoidia bacterium]
MHSFTLAIENFFVPHDNLVGGDAGVSRASSCRWAGSRLGGWTGGRACGVAEQPSRKACQYVSQRQQFGRPVADYQLTQHRIGMMVTHIAASRRNTYAARGFNTRAVEPAMTGFLPATSPSR